MKRLFTIFSLLLSLTLCFGAQPAIKTQKKSKPKTTTHAVVSADTGKRTQKKSKPKTTTHAVKSSEKVKTTQKKSKPQNSSKPPVKIDPHKENWTVGLKGGINYFSLLRVQQSPIEVDGIHYGVRSDISQQFAAFSEYNFNRFIGVGAYFGNYCYNRYVVLGSSIEFGLYAHCNVLEIFSWKKAPLISRRLHIFVDTGLGVGALWQNNQIFGHSSSDKVIWNAAAVLKMALQFEFMIKPQWGVFLEGEYHGYGRGNKDRDNPMYSSPWINAGMISAGVRYYFDDRKKETDPMLDENDLPIRTKKPREKKVKMPKNALYLNMNVNSTNRESTIQNDTTIAMQITMPNLSVSPKPQSKEIEGALQVLGTQGTGMALFNSIHLVNNQLTDESMKVLDEIANTLIDNNTKWNKVELLYVTNERANERAAIIATYLRAKGIKHIVARGHEGEENSDKSDLIVNIK